MEEETIEKIKCPKCGFENVKGTRKCIKCKAEIRLTKSCPKCAKRNKLDAIKCVNCGYNFNKKSNLKNLIFNLIISLILIVILSLLVYFEHKGVVNNISNIFKIVAVLFIFLLLYRTVNYGSKDINKFSAEEEILDDSKFVLLRKISNIAIVIGTIGVTAFLIYYYFIR